MKKTVNDKYEAASGAFKHILQSVKYVSITIDIWSDLQMRSYLGATLHYIDDFKLKSFTIGVMVLSEPHSASYISSELENFLKNWGIPKEKVVAVVTDNGANVVKAVHDTFTKNKHVPCFAHTLNLVC